MLRRDQDAGAETDPLGDRRRPRERDDRVVQVRARVVLLGRLHDVVAHPDAGEAERLGVTGRLGDRLGSGDPSVLREVDADVHARHPAAAGDRRSTLAPASTGRAGGAESDGLGSGRPLAGSVRGVGDVVHEPGAGEREPYLAARLQGFGTTIFAEMSALAVRTGAINLGQGFPDTDGPAEVADAAIAAIRDGHNQYPPGPGIPDLRAAIAEHQRRFWAIDLDPDREVLVTAGATEAIAAALIALCEPGDEVVTFEPFYDSYRAAASIAGASLAVVTLTPPDGGGPYRFDLAALEAAVTPRTRLLLLNSPHNPTGKVFDRAELSAIARLCVEHDLLAVTDEVYEHLVYDGEHVPLSTLPGMAERTVTISSGGKTFSFTGWKVGWATGPEPLVAAVRTAKQFLTYVNAAPFQPAIAVGLRLGDDYYEALRARLAPPARRPVRRAGAGRPPHHPARRHLLRDRRPALRGRARRPGLLPVAAGPLRRGRRAQLGLLPRPGPRPAPGALRLLQAGVGPGRSGHPPGDAVALTLRQAGRPRRRASARRARTVNGAWTEGGRRPNRLPTDRLRSHRAPGGGARTEGEPMTDRSTSTVRRRRRRIAIGVVALLAVLATGCDIQKIRPPGAAPLRYRDAVFTNVTRTNGLTYGQAPDQTGAPKTLLLDLYQPTGDTVTGRPAIVWVHGGSFCCGNRTSAEIVDQANTFALKGFVNVSIEYRTAPGGCTGSVPVQVCLQAVVDAKHDAQAAVRFLRANAATYRVDPNRIAVAGTSAGAITALNVAYGADDVGSSGNPGFPSTVRGAVSLSGAQLLTAPDPGEPPTLLFHGTADPLVPYSWATRTVSAAQAAGTQAYLTTWTGAGHVPYVQFRTQILDETTNFLWWVMDLANAAR